MLPAPEGCRAVPPAAAAPAPALAPARASASLPASPDHENPPPPMLETLSFISAASARKPRSAQTQCSPPQSRTEEGGLVAQHLRSGLRRINTKSLLYLPSNLNLSKFPLAVVRKFCPQCRIQTYQYVRIPAYCITLAPCIRSTIAARRPRCSLLFVLLNAARKCNVSPGEGRDENAFDLPAINFNRILGCCTAWTPLPFSASPSPVSPMSISTTVCSARAFQANE